MTAPSPSDEPVKLVDQLHRLGEMLRTDGHGIWATTVDEAAKALRQRDAGILAEIVAWLRDGVESNDDRWRLADAIERGDFRPKGEKAEVTDAIQQTPRW